MFRNGTRPDGAVGAQAPPNPQVGGEESRFTHPRPERATDEDLARLTLYPERDRRLKAMPLDPISAAWLGWTRRRD